MSKLRGNPWAILITLCLGFFMTLLDVTIVNIAIPSMIEHLHASLDEILWVINAYTLALAVLLITAGRLGEMRGQRNIFIAGVALFTIASALCGLSQTPGQLIAARVAQGIGAAVLLPQTLAITIGVFPPQKRGTALGVWAGVMGVATVAGPTLGGLLVTAFDWRSIFFVNLPIGLLVFVFSFVIIPDQRLARRHRFDLAGVVLATATLFCIAFALIEGERYDWGTIWQYVTIPRIAIAGGVLFVLFLLQQRMSQASEPLLPFELFRNRNYSIMNVVGMTISVAMVGCFLPLTLYLQSVLGMSALRAGLALAPMSLVSMFVSPLAGRLSDRIGGKYILMFGLTLFAAGLAMIVSVVDVDSSALTLLPGLIVGGFGMGCSFAPMNTIALRDIQPQMAGAASSVLNTARQMGAVLGAAAVGALLQNRLAHSLATEAVDRTASMPPRLRDGLVASFRELSQGGLEVGARQTPGPQGQPGAFAQEVVAQLQRAAANIYHHGFILAMRPTMLLTAAVVLVAAACCLLVRRTPARPPAPKAAPPVEKVESAAS